MANKKETKKAAAPKAAANTDKEATPKQVNLDDAIAEAEANLASLKADKRKADLEEARKAKLEAAKNDKRPTYEASNGLVWRFKKDTPGSLNVDGAPKKLDAIIKDKEVMAELVSGNSNFLELVN